MKKVLAMLGALCVMGSASALEMSVGGMVDYNYRGASVKDSMHGGDMKMSSGQSAIGLKAFFDAQYATVSLGGVFDVGKMKAKMSMGGNSMTEKMDMQLSYLSIGLLGKYPFAVGGIAKIYPLVGFEFDIALGGKMMGQTMKDFRKNMKANADHYWFDLGVGSDIAITEHFLVRPQFVFGMQMNKPEQYKDAKAFGYKVDIGIGAAYKF